MSQEQQDTVVGRLARKRSEAKKHLALLQEESREFSKVFTGLGGILQPSEVWNVSLESYQAYLSKETHEKIAKLRKEIPLAEQELARLDDEWKKVE